MQNLLPFEYCKRGNVYALVLSVVKKMSPDDAIQHMKLLPAMWTPKGITQEDVESMVRMKLKENMTYEAIGQIYHLNMQAVYRRISRYLQKQNKSEVSNC